MSHALGMAQSLWSFRAAQAYPVPHSAAAKTGHCTPRSLPVVQLLPHLGPCLGAKEWPFNTGSGQGPADGCHP